MLLPRVLELVRSTGRLQSWTSWLPAMWTSLTSFLPLFLQNCRAHSHFPISFHLEQCLSSQRMIKHRFFLNRNWVALTYQGETRIGDPFPVLRCPCLVKSFSEGLFQVISKNILHKGTLKLEHCCSWSEFSGGCCLSSALPWVGYWPTLPLGSHPPKCLPAVRSSGLLVVSLGSIFRLWQNLKLTGLQLRARVWGSNCREFLGSQGPSGTQNSGLLCTSCFSFILRA